MIDGRLSFALMLRRGNAHIASGYASQPHSSPERKILRAVRFLPTLSARLMIGIWRDLSRHMLVNLPPSQNRAVGDGTSPSRNGLRSRRFNFQNAKL